MEKYDYLLEEGKKDGIVKNVVGAVIVNEQGKILIMSRKEDDFIGNMENGEDIVTSLSREIKEETNCNMKEILYYITSFDYKSGSGKKARQYNFAITVTGTDNIILTEHDAYSWKNTEEILHSNKITPEVKEVIKKYIEIG